MIERNPFTERGRITAPARFIGRWRELSILFDQIEQRRPVLVCGTAGIGRSSLITHVVQAAAANLEMPDLRTFYLSLAGAQDAQQVYGTLTQALGGNGSDSAALNTALALSDAMVLFGLDQAEAISGFEWGQQLLEALARMQRQGNLIVVAAVRGEPPLLSERYAVVRMGAFAPTEVRLLTDTYLEGTGVAFSAGEIAELTTLSASHPAYLQRAAFHLYRAKTEPGYDWRSQYLAEVRQRPIPGAALPPAAFESDSAADEPSEPRYEQPEPTDSVQRPVPFQPTVLPPELGYVTTILLGILVGSVSEPLYGLLIASMGCLLLWGWRQR